MLGLPPVAVTDRLLAPAAVRGFVLPVLERVDLDPCGHPASHVPAAQTFQANDAALERPWSGRVWLFPPNRSEQQGPATLDRWVAKAHREYQRGATILALLPPQTGSGWFHDLVTESAGFTLVRHRLPLVGDDQPVRQDREQLTVMWSRDPGVIERYQRLSDPMGLLVTP